MATVDRSALLARLHHIAHKFRLPMQEDVKPGAELYTVHLRADGSAEGYPEPIRLYDDQEWTDTSDPPSVPYRLLYHPQMQGYVSRDYLLSVNVEQDLAPYLTTLFLVSR